MNEYILVGVPVFTSSAQRSNASVETVTEDAKGSRVYGGQAHGMCHGPQVFFRPAG